MRNQVDETLALMLRAISDLTHQQQRLAVAVARLKAKQRKA